MRVLEAIENRWPSALFVAFGFLYAWLDLIGFSPCVFTVDSATAIGLHSTFSDLLIVFEIIFASGFFIAFRYIDRLLSSRTSPILSAISTSAGTLLCLLIGNGILPSWLIYVAIIFCAFGVTLCFFFFVKIYAELDAAEVVVSVALSRIFAAFLYFMIAGLPSVLSAILITLLPLGFLSAQSLVKRASEKQYAREDILALEADKLAARGVTKGAFMRFLIVCFFVFFAVNTNTIPSAFSWYFAEVGTVVFAVALIAVSITFDNKVIFVSRWFYVAIAAVVIAFAFSSVSSSVSEPIYTVSWSLRALLDILLISLMILIIRRTRTSPARSFGLMHSVYLLGAAAGSLYGTFTRGVLMEPAYSIIIYATALLVCIALLLIFPPRDFETLLGFSREKKKTRNGFDGRLDHMEQFAESRGFSPRESDVFTLLLEGRNTRAIASKLFLSESTVKTHLHSIYLKADVSSRKQLIELARNAEFAEASETED